MCYVPSFRKPHLPEKETGGTGLETILQKSKTKTTTTTKAHKISKFELTHHVLVTDYFPAEWRPDLGSRRRRRAHARKAREGNGNRSFPKRAFFSTIGQLQTFDAPKRYYYWSMKTLKPKRHLFGQSTRPKTFVAPTDIVNGQWKCLQTFVAPTDTIRHWPLKVALSSTCLVVKSSIMTIMIAGGFDSR